MSGKAPDKRVPRFPGSNRGGAGKVQIGPVYREGAEITDPDGLAHDYPDRG